MFPASNLVKRIFKKVYRYSFFYLIFHWLMERFQELATKELFNFTKILISIVFY